MKLHVGSGDAGLPGWTNLDLLPYPGVDRVADVRRGIPYRGVRFIFAEHFIEHLALDEALAFLAGCRKALADDGVLRLSTPNLDWVWLTHYSVRDHRADDAAVGDALRINRAFHGWGHQFLYNRQTLRAILHDAGFAEVAECAWGESSHQELRGVEQHARSSDATPHTDVLVVEARGRRERRAESPFASAMLEYKRDVRMPFHALQYSALWFTRLASRILRRR